MMDRIVVKVMVGELICWGVREVLVKAYNCSGGCPQERRGPFTSGNFSWSEPLHLLLEFHANRQLTER